MAEMKDLAEHLLKMCVGILAGVYGLVLDVERHEQLLKDLHEAITGARSTPKLTEQEEVLASLERMTDEQRRELFERVTKK